MIDGNVIKFGYGDVAVGGLRLEQQMRFQQFKPPAKIGDHVYPDKVEWVGEVIRLDISYEEYRLFKDSLQEVRDKHIETFEFKGYIFDFTNYNEESIDVCNRKANEAMYCYFMCLAA